eukprot:CAMPEP_0182465748 /NCGR_PEP_ID=MMETSP1319-20130603/10595_1 /TAXON_ID=172717 /ORGANISM="Bolidomonas pacifica, Strain RCC208" /LENGTH=140 /DNA_ID=CAMNT_0024665591 /DNA_START=115 /DNA_END=534 /DNA_ORIENTATION=-
MTTTPPPPVQYHDSDFDFSKLVAEGKRFEAALMEAISSSSSSPPHSTLSTVDSSNSTLAWNAFHTRHSSATFFKPKRYIPSSFPSTMKVLRGLPRPPRILEVGCGAGAALFPIMAALEGHKEGKATALAIDVSDKALSLL